MRIQITLLLVGAALVGSAVLARVWLASTGGYSASALSVPLRIASALSLAAGLVLAAVSVVWPIRKERR